MLLKSSAFIDSLSLPSYSFTYLDSADGLQPGALFHRRANMHIYKKKISVSGVTYDEAAKETCKIRMHSNLKDISWDNFMYDQR